MTDAEYMASEFACGASRLKNLTGLPPLYLQNWQSSTMKAGVTYPSKPNAAMSNAATCATFHKLQLVSSMHAKLSSSNSQDQCDIKHYCRR